MLPDGAAQDVQGLGCLCTLTEHPLERERCGHRLPPTRCYASLGGHTWRQWTVMEEEEGRAQQERYRFKVSEDLQWELSNPKWVTEKAVVSFLEVLKSQQTDLTVAWAPTSQVRRPEDGKGSFPALHAHNPLIWITQFAVQSIEFTVTCCLLNHRSEICYLWKIIKHLSFSRLPLVKWVLLLSF